MQIRFCEAYYVNNYVVCYVVFYVVATCRPLTMPGPCQGSPLTKLRLSGQAPAGMLRNAYLNPVWVLC